MLSNNSNNRINLYLNNGKINNGALSVDQIAFISVKLKLEVYYIQGDSILLLKSACLKVQVELLYFSYEKKHDTQNSD